MSLFDYAEFLEELKNHSDETKREIYEKWIKISNVQKLEDEPFYEYLMQFEAVPYNVPEELEEDFDWNLLLRLCAASFSSHYKLALPNDDSFNKNIAELEITVSSGDQTVTKNISELWSFQILRMHEIYLEEQINLYTLACEDEAEQNCIESEKKERVKLYNFNKLKIKKSLLRNSLLK